MTRAADRSASRAAVTDRRRSTSRVVAALVGGRAAVEAPRWTRGRRFERLLDEGRDAVDAGGSAEPIVLPSPGAILGVRIARALLRRLARLPLSPWRNTCLYRSIAECVVLRHYGVPATIRLGVRREGASSDAARVSPPETSRPEASAIVAHAWVVYPGSPDVDDETLHVPLVSAPGPRA